MLWIKLSNHLIVLRKQKEKTLNTINLDPDKKIEELEIIRKNYLNSINAKPEERRVQRVFESADRE